MEDLVTVRFKYAMPNSIIREDCAAVIERLEAGVARLHGARFLVTGAGGFLMSYLIDALAQHNAQYPNEVCQIVAIDNFITGVPERLSHLREYSWFTLYQHDIRQPFSTERAFDYIVHGASIASPLRYRAFPLETIDVNVTGLRGLLEKARQEGCKSFVFMSSSEVYGDPEPSQIPTKEDYVGRVAFAGPRACYDESKRLGETLCWIYHHEHAMAVKVVRPFNVYGPGQRLDDGRVVPDMLSAALERRPIRLFSDGRATRSFCYVTDQIAGIIEILLHGQDGEAYNVGNAEEISILDAAKLMAEIAGDKRVFVEFARSADENYTVDNPQRRCPDVKKLTVQTRWRPMVTFAHGLRRTYESYAAPRSVS